MQEALGTTVDIADGNAIHTDTKTHFPATMRILEWVVTTPYFRVRYTDMDDAENRKRHHKKHMRVLLIVYSQFGSTANNLTSRDDDYIRKLSLLLGYYGVVKDMLSELRNFRGKPRAKSEMQRRLSGG